MTKVNGEILIERPVDEVFDFVADERNEPLYNPRMLSVEAASDQPAGPGSRFDAVLRSGRRSMPLRIEFTEFSRPKRIESVAHSPMMTTTGGLHFEPVAGGTRMSWSWEVRPRGTLRLMPALVRVIGRREERRIWTQLKHLLEAEPAPGRARGGAAPEQPIAPAAQRRSVLVAYASGNGSTQEVAMRIGARLRTAALRVVVAAVSDVDGVEGYDAVILASPVYGQRWLPAATEFAHEHAAALAGRQVWLFSLGAFGDTHRLVGRMMLREPRDIDELKRLLAPLQYRVFAGSIHRHQWPWASRQFFHLLGGRLGDNRDWAGIDAWVDGIARTLASVRSRG